MMEIVVHYGKDGKAPIRSFQEKRADMVLRNLKDMTASNLKQIKLAVSDTYSTTAQIKFAY